MREGKVHVPTPWATAVDRTLAKILHTSLLIIRLSASRIPARASTAVEPSLAPSDAGSRACVRVEMAHDAIVL